MQNANYQSNICLILFVILCSGCVLTSNAGVGGQPDLVFSLDEASEFSQNIDLHDKVAIDVPWPGSEQSITGVSFDPGVLSLLHFFEVREDGNNHVRYVFTAEEPGTTAVIIKTAPDEGGAVQIYRQATITVESNPGVF